MVAFFVFKPLASYFTRALSLYLASFPYSTNALPLYLSPSSLIISS
jgi:hypothetical protein